jgi:xanthine dehydrogenase YagT iron-sulfur-binding subunit
MQLSMHVNGRPIELDVPPHRLLSQCLREELSLTGTHIGCDTAQCGACTVLLDGKRINSCLSLAVMHDGSELTTIEGIANGDELHAVQQAFIDEDAFQCGYCTAGQICSAIGLIRENKARTAEDIRDLMSGNLCRCGAYTNIFKVVQQALERSRT